MGRVAAERRPGGGALHRPRENRLDHAVQIRVHLIVPEPQRQKIFRREVSVAPPVMPDLRAVAMLRSVDLDDQFAAETDEIQKLAPERRLTAEMQALRTQETQLRPDFDLLRRHALPQTARVCVRHAFSSCFAPHAARSTRHPPHKGEGLPSKR